MRKFVVGFCLLIVSSLSSIAQESSFGQVTEEDFNTVFENEEDAPAVILFDIGKSEFRNEDNYFKIHFTRTIRIKINSKEGLGYGEVMIMLYRDGYNKTEYAKDIQGYTYIKDEKGIKRIPLGIDLIYEENVNEYYRAKKFAMPSVRENSIIEYTYTIVTPFLFNLPDWEFQHSIPTLYSSYQVSLIPFYEYSFRLQGANRFDYQNSQLAGGIPRRVGSIEFQDMIHTYVMKNVPSFTDESFITTRQDYIMKLDFQLAKYNRISGGSEDIMTTWEDLNETYLKDEDFGKFMKQSGKYAGDIIEKIPASEDKVQWIVEYVRENYSWDGIFRRKTIQKAKEFADSRTGNSAEINLFLCAALNEAGIDARPVLISTRNHGKIHSNYPFADQFNSVVVLVNTSDGLILTDGTEEYLPYNTIPPLCINGQGLVVNDDKGNFVNLTGYTNSQTSLNLSMTPNPDNGRIEGGVLFQAQGYEAYRVRKMIDTDLDEYKENSEKYGITGIKDFETSNSDGDKFTMRYVGHGELEQLGENIVIAPFLNWPESENPLKSRERKYPVDMTYSSRHIFTSQIKIPEGYALEDIPGAYSVDDGLVKLNYSCKILGDHIVTSGEVFFKKSVYSNREYAKLRAHYIQMVELFNQELILVKDHSAIAEK